MEGLTEYKIKIGEQSKAWHIMYLRKHRVRETANQMEMPSERTLYASGIPAFINEESIQYLFGRFGTIARIHLKKPEFDNSLKLFPKLFAEYAMKQRSSCKVDGYIVFDNVRGLENALAGNNQCSILKFNTMTLGMKKWPEEFNNMIHESKSLQNSIDDYMNIFDGREKSEEDKLKASTEEDEEGWTTVTKKSRKHGFTRKESVLKHISDNVAKKKDKKELNNFYRFQIKESKMKNLLTLRQKFDEDRKRIAALKATRRFKPF